MAVERSSETTSLIRSFGKLAFGYDVFISFALGDLPRGTQRYARDLADRLRDRNLSVFFSEQEAPPGYPLLVTLRRALSRSRMLVVVANRAMLDEPRWVRDEVEEFRRRQPRRPICVINIDHALQDPDLSVQVEGWLRFRDKIWADETLEAVDRGKVSEAVLDRIGTVPTAMRAATRWKVLVSGVLALIASVLAVAGWKANEARETSTKLVYSEGQTEEANAKSIAATVQRDKEAIGRLTSLAAASLKGGDVGQAAVFFTQAILIRRKINSPPIKDEVWGTLDRMLQRVIPVSTPFVYPDVVALPGASGAALFQSKTELVRAKGRQYVLLPKAGLALFLGDETIEARQMSDGTMRWQKNIQEITGGNPAVWTPSGWYEPKVYATPSEDDFQVEWSFVLGRDTQDYHLQAAIERGETSNPGAVVLVKFQSSSGRSAITASDEVALRGDQLQLPRSQYLSTGKAVVSARELALPRTRAEIQLWSAAGVTPTLKSRMNGSRVKTQELGINREGVFELPASLRSVCSIINELITDLSVTDAAPPSLKECHVPEHSYGYFRRLLLPGPPIYAAKLRTDASASGQFFSTFVCVTGERDANCSVLDQQYLNGDVGGLGTIFEDRFEISTDHAVLAIRSAPRNTRFDPWGPYYVQLPRNRVLTDLRDLEDSGNENADNKPHLLGQGSTLASELFDDTSTTSGRCVSEKFEIRVDKARLSVELRLDLGSGAITFDRIPLRTIYPFSSRLVPIAARILCDGRAVLQIGTHVFVRSAPVPGRAAAMLDNAEDYFGVRIGSDQRTVQRLPSKKISALLPAR